MLKLKKLFNATFIKLVFIGLALMTGIHPIISYAMTKSAQSSIINGRPWYDPSQDCTIDNTVSDSSNTPAASDSTNVSNRDKLAGLVFARAYTLNDVTSLKTGKAGGIFLGPQNKDDRAFFDGVKGALAGSTVFTAVDFEGGRVQRPGSGIVGAVPSAQELGSKSVEEVKAIAKTSGQQLANLGINMDFAPVVDIGGTNTAVIGDRAFGNDANTVTEKAGAFAAGLSESGVISVLKHFPGHGSRNGDSHTGPVSIGGLAELEARDLKPYQTLSQNAKTAIMMGHLKVAEWGETPTSLNPQAYEYIRQVLNFNGVVITDALDMQGISDPPDEAGRAVAAIKAGADAALLNSPGQFAPTVQKLEAELASGGLTQTRVDEAFGRLSALRTSSNAQPIQSEGCGPCPTGGTIPVDGDNPKRMFEYLVSKGLSAAQAAGVTGNAMAESSPLIDPTIVSPSGYRGIFQWDKNNRWPRLVSWAQSKDKEPLTFEAQLEFAYQEAEERGNIEGLKQQTSVELATWYWGRYYEVAIIGGNASNTPLTNVQHLDKRTTFARSVLDQLGGSSGSGAAAQTYGCVSASGQATLVGDLAWPVDVRFWQQEQSWFTKPHHDYPAADIPVPTNTAIYSMSSGTVEFITEGYGGGCGEGVAIKTGGALFQYCHGIPGSLKVGPGQSVRAGDQIFMSDNTGNSTGPHLHLGIKVGGVKRCPQELFKKMGAGETSIDLANLPIDGCSY